MSKTVFVMLLWETQRLSLFHRIISYLDSILIKNTMYAWVYVGYLNIHKPQRRDIAHRAAQVSFLTEADKRCDSHVLQLVERSLGTSPTDLKEMNTANTVQYGDKYSTIFSFDMEVNELDRISRISVELTSFNVCASQLCCWPKVDSDEFTLEEELQL